MRRRRSAESSRKNPQKGNKKKHPSRSCLSPPFKKRDTINPLISRGKKLGKRGFGFPSQWIIEHFEGGDRKGASASRGVSKKESEKEIGGQTIRSACPQLSQTDTAQSRQGFPGRKEEKGDGSERLC